MVNQLADPVGLLPPLRGKAGMGGVTNVIRAVACVGFLWGGASMGISAAERPTLPSDPAPTVSTEPPDFLKPAAVPSFPVVRVVLTLALLMGVLYFIRPLLKKTKWGGASIGGVGLDILSRAYLGPKAGICLVQAEGRKFLVGVGADGVRLLADLGTSLPEERSRE